MSKNKALNKFDQLFVFAVSIACMCVNWWCMVHLYMHFGVSVGFPVLGAGQVVGLLMAWNILRGVNLQAIDWFSQRSPVERSGAYVGTSIVYLTTVGFIHWVVL